MLEIVDGLHEYYICTEQLHTIHFDFHDITSHLLTCSTNLCTNFSSKTLIPRSLCVCVCVYQAAGSTFSFPSWSVNLCWFGWINTTTHSCVQSRRLSIVSIVYGQGLSHNTHTHRHTHTTHIEAHIGTPST